MLRVRKWLPSFQAAICAFALGNVSIAEDRREAKSTLHEVQPSVFQADVKLDDLRVGETCVLMLTLVNNNPNIDISLLNASASCGCISAEVLSDTLKAQDSTVVEIKLKPPVHSKRTSWRQLITFREADGKANSLRISLSASLAGVLAVESTFENIMMLATSREAATDHMLSRDVHLEFSDPVKFSNLVVKGSQKANRIKAALVETSKTTAILRLNVPARSIEEAGIAGAIIVHDQLTKREVSLSVTAAVRENIEVLPSELRFHRTETGEALESNPVLIANRSARQLDQEQPDIAKISALLNGESVKVISSDLATGVKRVRLRYPIPNDTNDATEKLLNAQKHQVQWHIIWGQEKASPLSVARVRISD